MNITLFQYLFTFFLYGLGALILAVAMTPSFAFLLWLWGAVNPQGLLSKAAVLSLGVGTGYFLFGLTLTLETILLRLALNLKLREGMYDYFSLETVKWAFVNALMLIVNLTFMDFMKLTPLLPLYYRCMGAKIGRRVQFNSKNMADISLMEIGDDSVVGGDAVLIGHIAEHGKLKLKGVKIGKRVTIGLGAVVMPGSQVGDRSLIAARSVLLKDTRVPPDSIYAGTPAKFLRTLDQVLD